MNNDTRGKTNIEEWFKVRREALDRLDSNFFEQIKVASEALNRAVLDGKKVLIFGNGGSAAEAQHFAAELVSQFEKKRKALPAIALTTDTSIITAQSNDFGFEYIFSRQIDALGEEGDIAIGFTTSDANDSHSKNIIEGFRKAKERGLVTIGFFSKKTSNLLKEVDFSIIVPDTNTAIIQEIHLSALHLLCRLVEDEL